MDRKAGTGETATVIEHKVHARVGLLGNPSDVYFGRTISLSLGNFWASVQLQPSENLVISPHPTHDLVQLNSLGNLVNRLNNEGYYGGVRLLMAICKVFHNYCKDNKIDLQGGNFTLSYDTNIPRQTGLSGSSAIVCAALNCLLDFYKVRHLIKVEVRPNLVLNAEKELGIVAGLQDRVAQVYGGLVYMDFSKKYMEDLGHGMYIPMDINLLPPLHLIYAENPSDSGKVFWQNIIDFDFHDWLKALCYLERRSFRYMEREWERGNFKEIYRKIIWDHVGSPNSPFWNVHSTVRQKWLGGDKFIISSMEQVANLALEGRTALQEKNYTKFADLMNRNFDLRRAMFGDDVLGALNIKMVEVARSVGAAVKFTGSGGAVVAFCPNGPSQVKLLQDACQKDGFVIQPVKVVPPCLNEIDLRTLSPQ